MCRPDNPPLASHQQEREQQQQQQQHVVIAGAGPAGLLLTALLLQRNDELGSSPQYKITLIDGRQDLSPFTADELKKSYRSWMLGLAGHGIGAIRTCHGLYDEYCKDVGIDLQSLSIHLGTKELVQPVTTPEEVEEYGNFIVDRNFIVAALARFVADKIKGMQGEQEHEKQQRQSNNDDGVDDQDVGPRICSALYEHKLLYVDYENRQVLVRNDKEEFYLPYDLLVGCDGVRSVVREALVKKHPTFEMDVGDIFQTFKAVHVARPPEVIEARMHLLPDCFPLMQGIALPETGNMLNISAGCPRHLFDKLPQEMKSDDPKVVAAYVKKTFKAFTLSDYDDFAMQWVSQRWNRTGQVHCNFYHSNEINVVLMGDAAHATSPTIGMGMNTALRDAQIFYQLLQKHEDRIDQVLSDYSLQRVKEGNSLTDLAMHLYCMDTKAQFMETLHLVARSMLHKVLPFIEEHPQAMIGRVKYDLSDVYEQATKIGIIPKHRRINNHIRQTYFEETIGMIPKKKDSSFSLTTWAWKVALIAAAGGILTTYLRDA